MKGSSPSIAAIGAYTPSAASSLPRCKRCGEYVVMTPDAIGRLNERCPKCDGVAKPRRAHPDEVLVPQTLVSREQLLPSIEAGQLRCQGCARGVDPAKRFCEACARAREPQRGTAAAPKYKPKQCKEPTCHQWFQPTGPRSEYCERCR